MKLTTASRKNMKIKMGIQGPSGSGKTYSALLLAYGLVNDWNKIGVIDTENNSSVLFDDLGEFKVLNINAPFNPEKYIEAIQFCVVNGIEVLIIDSISHEWAGIGGILDLHRNMPGNSYTNWAKLTPRHDAFIETILQLPIHVICTIRSKQDYILLEKNGKKVPQKIGMKGITRNDLDYEFTLVFELDIEHKVKVSKDRTQLFNGKTMFTINPATGIRLLAWCNQDRQIKEEIKKLIEACTSPMQLNELYQQYPHYQESLLPEFTSKRNSFQSQQLNNIQKSTQNGTINIK